MSQRSLAAVLGVTFQQVQKYEQGANRIAVVTLVRAAEALETPLSHFMEGFGPGDPTLTPKASRSFRTPSTDILETIEDRKLRAALRTLARALISSKS
jgi:transcriptional regulator with XRE-family HTH domain